MIRLRVPLATAVILSLAQAAPAATLCRDGKGLFAPCPRSANRVARAILSGAPAQETGWWVEDFAQRPLPSLHPTSTFGMRKPLCTNAKGLLTTCGR